MQNRYSWRSVGLALAAVITGAPAVAVDKLNADAFIDACKAFQGQTEADGLGSVCKAYLQGYFAGRVDVVIEEDLPSPFMQRALRTRAPSVTPGIEAIKESRYCLSREDTYRDFAAKAVAMDKKFVQGIGADKVIERVLEQYYRCKS